MFNINKTNRVFFQSKEFEWIKKGTHAIMMGPRGENTAIGKAAEKAGITKVSGLSKILIIIMIFLS